MRLSLLNFPSLVGNAAAAVQASATELLDLTAGSVLRAVLEANASIALWMQWLTVQVLQTTRAATSNGADLDTWLADFGVARLPATAASGQVTFSRFTPSAAALVPLGAQVRTLDGTQSFAVVPDTANPNYVVAAGGYPIPAGTASVNATVTAATPGAAGNVQPGSVALLGTAIPGVDTVTNGAALASGADAESDPAVRARFTSFLDTRSRATTRAVGYAIAGVQQGLAWSVQENTDGSGAVRPGNFLVTVDDGTGAPSASVLGAVQAAIEPVRPIGSTFQVQGPTVTRASVGMTVTTASLADKPAAAMAVQGAVQSFLNTLPVGAPLPLTRLAQVAYGASTLVTNVTGLTINGAAGDLAPGATGVVKAGMVTVTVS